MILLKMELPPGVTEFDVLREIRNTTCTVQLNVHNCCYYVERKYKNALRSRGLPYDEDRQRQVSDLISVESYAAYKKRYARREAWFKGYQTFHNRLRRHLFIEKIKSQSIQTVCMESERNEVPNLLPKNITNPTESIMLAKTNRGQERDEYDSDTSDGSVVTVICTD